MPKMIFLILFFFISFERSFGAKYSAPLPVDIFVKASQAFNDKNGDFEEKKKSVESILALLDENPDFSYRHYWRAVFLTFQCELADKGRIIPGCIISELSNIKSLLFHAHKEYPEYYHYAPARTLGIMYLKMPAIVGGSNKKAIAYLKEATEGAPDFKENAEWLSRVK
ncbi:hypothetical protein AZI86_01075 [Bdellovibrio bacteriovorus]|uniref:Tetratricopeptide repeat protein n=1 Tax=Bdellovibrio bacteriovorus TaxID=959 RepID=A0A150WMS9_BDEBC|nr:hypothetical protein [Bdellovibrio bacteriovorus]KYG65698.1 hypothetical protein AZI86_01075 [Bdellovibrio bacteriovorus]